MGSMRSVLIKVRGFRVVENGRRKGERERESSAYDPMINSCHDTLDYIRGSRDDTLIKIRQHVTGS